MRKHFNKKRSEKSSEKSSEKMEQLNYEELFMTGIKELRFQLLVRDSLLSTIDEVVAMTTDPLAKKILLLAKQRESLDRLIHSRNIFGDK